MNGKLKGIIGKNKDKRRNKIETKTKRLIADGWEKDPHYTCIYALENGMVIHGLTHKDHDSVVWCPYCGDKIYEVQTHFHIGKNFKIA